LFCFGILYTYCFSYGQVSKPQNLFPPSPPEQQGISSSVLDSLLLFIKNTHQNIHHLTIVRNDHTVLDADFYPYSPEYPHDLASVTKSFTSLLIGIAIDKGFIRDEYEKVLPFFPEISGHNPMLDSLTIKDLLTMTSGFACGVSDGEKALSDMRKGNDWVRFIFNLPFSSKPGETFSYCSCNYYLLAEIIYRATRMTPHEFAKKYLFGPLDMTKIGKMVSDRGRWQNKQIVSEQWIQKSLKTFVRLPDDKGYGYGWWTNDKAGFYEAAGRGRQTISVIPARNMIVTMLGGEFDAGVVGKYIFQSIRSDSALPGNQAGLSALKTSLKEVAITLSSVPIPLNNLIIQKINKRTITLEKNIAEIDSLKFEFISGQKGIVIFYKGLTKEKYPFAFSTSSYALGFDPILQLPVASQGYFEGEHKFILHFNQLCRINNFYFEFTVNDSEIIATMVETSNNIRVNIGSSLTNHPESQ